MRIFLLLFFVYATAANAGDQEPGAVEDVTDFNRYVKILLEKNPGLKSLNAAVEAKKQVPDQAGTLPDPMIKLALMNVPYDPVGFKEEGMTQKQIGISQMFPARGKLEMKRKIAQDGVEIASTMIPEKRIELIKEARITFHKMIFLQKRVETIKKNKEIMKGFIQVAHTKYSVGTGLQQNVLHAQVELTKMSDKLRGTEQKLNSAGNLLAVWGDLPIDYNWKGINIDPLQKVDGSVDDLLEKALENRSMFEKMRAKIKMAGDMVKLARLGLKIDYTAGFAYGQRDDGPMGERNDLVTAWVGLKIPFYRKTKQEKKIAQNLILQDKARHEMIEAKWKVRYQIANLRQIESKDSYLLVLYDTGLIPQASQSVEASLAAYQVNKVDFLTLVSNQITLFNYELKRDKIGFELQSARARLRRVLGMDETEVRNAG